MYLQVFPDLKPAELLKKITQTDAKAVVYSSGSDNDYDVYGLSTWGQNTNMLYSKYNNSQIFTLSGPHTISIGS